MKLTNRCQLNGKTYTMELNCTPSQFHNACEVYAGGALLQHAFDFLTAEEREFVKTGTPPHIWNEMFGGDVESQIIADHERAVAEAFDQAVSDANERAYGGTID
jgi:hypothetical protein